MKEQLKNKKGKVIGIYDENKNRLKKTVKKSIHLFKKLNAWGIDGEFLHEKMKPNGIIEIYSPEERLIYVASREKMLEEGKHLKFGEHGLQVFLPLDEWEKHQV